MRLKNKIIARDFCWFIAVAFVCIIRLLSVFFMPDVFSDEEIIVNHISSIRSTGYDAWGTPHPLYSWVGSGQCSFVYMYPMILLSFLLGSVTVTKIRIIQQVLTIISCIVVTISVGKWNKNKNVLWILLLTLLTLPWGFVQANRVWDPALVPFYFSIYFYCFSVLMNDEVRNKRRLFLILTGVFLVLLATVYPPARIPSVVLWIYSVVWSLKKKVVRPKDCLWCIVASSLVSIPLVFYLLKPEFNYRAASLLVFKDGEPLLRSIYIWLKNIFAMYSPDFLFVTGDDNYRHSLPVFGLLGTISIIPLWKFFRTKKFDLFDKYLLTIIMVTNISVGLTDEGIPHSLRSCLAWIPYSIIIYQGWLMIWEKSDRKKRLSMTIICSICFLIYIATFFYFGVNNITEI